MDTYYQNNNKLIKKEFISSKFCRAKRKLITVISGLNYQTENVKVQYGSCTTIAQIYFAPHPCQTFMFDTFKNEKWFQNFKIYVFIYKHNHLSRRQRIFIRKNIARRFIETSSFGPRPAHTIERSYIFLNMPGFMTGQIIYFTGHMCAITSVCDAEIRQS